MTPRLTSAMLVSALVRRVNQAGGAAMVLARGQDESGAILLICLERGVFQSVRERVLGMDGQYDWAVIGPDSAASVDAYLERRRNNDPDLWLIELDVAQAERFAAEMTGPA